MTANTEQAQEELTEQPAQQEPTCKQNLQVWVISNGKGKGQFSWEPQDERYWTRMEPTVKQSLTIEKPAQQQEPVACKTLCELCVKRGYTFCANAAQTTPIPSPPARKPLVGLSEQERNDLEDYCEMIIGKAAFDAIEAKLREKNT